MEPSPSSFFKVNLKGIVVDVGARGGVSFVIRGPHEELLAAGGVQLLDTAVPRAELRGA